MWDDKENLSKAVPKAAIKAGIYEIYKNDSQ